MLIDTLKEPEVVVRSHQDEIKRVTIYQPQFFPRLHYFNRVFSADTFVFLDSAQYVKSLVHEGAERKRYKSYQSDTPIKTGHGLTFLTVPIKHNGQQSIHDTIVHYQEPWPRRHLAAIRNFYGKAAYFPHYFADIEELLSRKYSSLGDLNIASTLWAIARLLEYDIPVEEITIETVNEKLKADTRCRLKHVLRDEDTGVMRPEGRQKGTEWTTAICKALGASEYMYGGTAQAGYMDIDYYVKNDITPVIQNWNLMEYEQQFTQQHGFIPNLSIIDLLLNVGPEESLQILTTNTIH